MNIMIRDPYYLAKTVLGSYNLYILKDPFESWHYSCVGTFNTKDEAIDYYHKLKEEEKMISRMHMKLIITAREIIEALGEFDLDPCAPMHPLWPTAKIMYNKQDNGLIQNWGGEFGLTLRTPNRLYGSL